MPPLSHLNALVIGTSGGWPRPDWNSSGIMLYCYIIRRLCRDRNDTSPPWTGSASSAGARAIIAAAVGAPAPLDCRIFNRADLGRGFLGNKLSTTAVTATIRFSNVTLGYDRHPAVHHLTGAVETGSLTAVVGPNGAGKSTLFKGITGGLKPPAGRIEGNGFGVRDIAYLPQAAEIDRSFPITVYDMVAMGLWRQTGPFGGLGHRQRDAIEAGIAAVGLIGFEQRVIGTLSGGQMQRLLFARLLIQDARLIVLDEPFSAIDGKTCNDLMQLVRRWHQEGRTIIAATHDIELVRANFPQTLLLAREPVAWGPTREVLTPENLTKARRMCEAFDEEAETCAVAVA